MTLTPRTQNQTIFNTNKGKNREESCSDTFDYRID